MITTIKDEQGKIFGYAEWLIVDDDGNTDTDGRNMCVMDMWIHKDYRNAGFFQELIARMFEESLEYSYEYVFYEREKYSGRPRNLTFISRFLRHTRLKNHQLFE